MATFNKRALSKILCHPKKKIYQNTWKKNAYQDRKSKKARRIIKTNQEYGRCHSQEAIT